MVVWTAVVIGVLAIGQSLPFGVSFHPDPATGRPMTYMASSNHTSRTSCELALARLKMIAYEIGFEADRKRSECVSMTR